MPIPSEKKVIKILMIGPLPPEIGGMTVSFKMLVDLLRDCDNAIIDVVDFNAIRRRKGNTLRGLLSLCRAVIPKARQVDVITVYLSLSALSSLGILLLVVSRVLGKPLIVRTAGGVDYASLGFLKGTIAHFVVKQANLFFVQTHNLVQLAYGRGISHVRWFPTSRPMCDNRYERSLVSERSSCRHFVFVGQVRECKGIREIIQASERFEEYIRVDIYGPLFDDLEQNIFAGCKIVKYYGVLDPEDVVPTLKRYDMLLLPTKALTEGYPGAVLEGYSAGLPIITTRCGGIPEIVDMQSGLFVSAGDSEALFSAMKIVVENDEIYSKLRKGVLEKREDFDSVMWARRFVDYCGEVVGKA